MIEPMITNGIQSQTSSGFKSSKKALHPNNNEKITTTATSTTKIALSRMDLWRKS